MHDFYVYAKRAMKGAAGFEFWQCNRVFLHLDYISSFQSDLCTSQGLGVDGFYQFYTLLFERKGYIAGRCGRS